MNRSIPEWTQVLTLSALMVAGGIGTAVSQEHRKPMKGHKSGSMMDKSMEEQKGQMSGSMMEECKSMMSAHRQMKDEMKAAAETLDALVATMNSAVGDAKISATADTVTKLVAQQTKMMSKMMSMQPEMMKHMTRHMRMEMSQDGEDSMECPMMKETTKGDPGPAAP